MMVKICGVTNRDDALFAAEAGAVAIGFNFSEEAKPKRRYIEPDTARRIGEELPANVLKVAVTVNANAEQLRAYLSYMDRVQLHGEETPAFAAEFGDRAIKALRTGPDFTPQRVLEYPVGLILLDAYVPGALGGTGERADWEIAREAVALGKPILLAGGLTPDNVAEAVRIVRPYGVDVSGGVEKGPGKKDHERVRRFIREAKLPVS
jgi:phosphoribosylanthranilate isomerase